MSVSYTQIACSSKPNKRQKIDTMAAPVFFQVDPNHYPYTMDNQQQTSIDSETLPPQSLNPSHFKRDRRKAVPRGIHTSGTTISPLLSPQLSLPDDDLHRRHTRQSSETPSMTSIASITSTFSTSIPSLPTLIRLRQPTILLPRTESHAIETEVLTIRHLSNHSVPVPSTVRLLRDRLSRKLTSAILQKPAGIPYHTVSWPLDDPRHEKVQTQILHFRSRTRKLRTAAFGSVATVAAGYGRASWRDAFLSMFNALLLDAEDAWVNLPFAQIRAALRKPWMGPEHTKDPELVIPGFGDRKRLLVGEETGDVLAFYGFREAFWGDPDAVSPDTDRPLYVLFQALRVVVLGSVRPEKVETDGGGKKVVDARIRIMNVLEELGVSADTNTVAKAT